MLEEALSYAARGWPVFPLRLGLKTPSTKNGFKDATVDPEQITSWWSEGVDYNIGIATGKASFTAIDPDGPHGAALLKTLPTPPPKTMLVKTPNGLHVYVTYDERFKQTARLMQADCDCEKKCGIDVRNDGGYVVAPPSIVGGKVYKWLEKVELQPWPEGTEIRRPVRDNGKEDWEAKPTWVADLLVNGASDGSRNSDAARLAGYFHSLHMPFDIGMASMKQFADACNPPMGYAELEETVRSIWRYTPPERKQYAGVIDPSPTIDQTVSGRLRFMWPEQGIFADCDRIKERSDGVTCWLTISQSTIGELYGPVLVNVLQPTFDERQPKKLRERYEANWDSIFQHIRAEVMRSLKDGGQSVDMGEYEVQAPSPWAVYPFVRRLQPNLIFGDGGNGKTTLGIALSISMALGISLVPGLVEVKEQGNTEYLDWETDEDEFASVRDALLKGHGLLDRKHELKNRLRYRRMIGPIEASIDNLVREVTDFEIRNVVVDSLVKAIGDDPNAANAARVFFQSLAALNTSALIFTHITNESVRRSGADVRPYGSVFWWDYCRNNWYIKRTTEEEPMKVGLFHSKLNRGRLLKPFGYEMEFQEENGITSFIKYRSTNILDSDLAVGANKIDRVVHLLLRVGSLSAAAIAEELDDEQDKIRSLLNRYKDKKVTLVSNGQWGALATAVTGNVTSTVTTGSPLGAPAYVVTPREEERKKEDPRLPYTDPDGDLDFGGK